jgi:hypothetical protein
MYFVYDILTGVGGETSELSVLRDVVCSLRYRQKSNVIVLDDEARQRALQKRIERQPLWRRNLGLDAFYPWTIS